MSALGQAQARKLGARLDDLRAAQSLESLRHLPGRCHELTANRKGQLSIDLVHPTRLVFEPAEEPLPLKEDGGLDWTGVVAIRILDIVDTHG
jgi:plasmid maintenance system killer protein